MHHFFETYSECIHIHVINVYKILCLPNLRWHFYNQHQTKQLTPWPYRCNNFQNTARIFTFQYHYLSQPCLVKMLFLHHFFYCCYFGQRIYFLNLSSHFTIYILYTSVKFSFIITDSTLLLTTVLCILFILFHIAWLYFVAVYMYLIILYLCLFMYECICLSHINNYWIVY